MIIRITMKDPDGVYDCIKQEVNDQVEGMKELTSDEWLDVVEAREERAHEAVRKWLQYLEYITVEIDTDADTCKVIRP